MDIENIKNTIRELEERLKNYISEISVPCLEYTPFIVEVGALTVSTDDKGVVIVENKYYPMQFSKSAVKVICSLSFRTCNDEIVKPKVYNKHEWYSQQIEHLRMTICELLKLITK